MVQMFASIFDLRSHWFRRCTSPFDLRLHVAITLSNNITFISGWFNMQLGGGGGLNSVKEKQCSMITTENVLQNFGRYTPIIFLL